MLLNYIKIAWKVLLRNPFYTFISLFGISFTLMILLVLSAFLDHIFGSHYPENQRDQSLYVQMTRMQDSSRQSTMTGPSADKFLKKNLSALRTPNTYGIFSMFKGANTYVDGKRIKLSIKYADGGFWEVTNFTFLEGKAFNESNFKNGDLVAVITDKIRDDYFGKGQSVVGKTMLVNGLKYRVMGVVAASPITRPVSYADVFLPFNSPKSEYESPGINGSYMAIVIPKNKANMPVITKEFEQIVGRIPKPFMENGMKVYHLESRAETYLSNFTNQIFGNDQNEVFFMVVALFMVLFMALPAINLVNLNISRIIERSSEISVRKAFGAPSKTVLWQFVVENVFVTLIGAGIALIFSQVILMVFNRSALIPSSDLTINFTVFGFGILLALIFGLMSGVYPAWRMSKLKPAEALKNS
ncbi:MAG: ABC transporter permease [Haliscomenobacter sp.]|nr:ABC transporter permease [Haliscomenobacter sp.]MBK9492327.1 ABC transporter permease [Haliscomenobacter sp.]